MGKLTKQVVASKFCRKIISLERKIQMAKHRIIIDVSGGVVTDVWADKDIAESLDVEILDFDNLHSEAEDAEVERIEDEHDENIKKMVSVA